MSRVTVPAWSWSPHDPLRVEPRCLERWHWNKSVESLENAFPISTLHSPLSSTFHQANLLARTGPDKPLTGRVLRLLRTQNHQLQVLTRNRQGNSIALHKFQVRTRDGLWWLTRLAEKSEGGRLASVPRGAYRTNSGHLRSNETALYQQGLSMNHRNNIVLKSSRFWLYPPGSSTQYAYLKNDRQN